MKTSKVSFVMYGIPTIFHPPACSPMGYLYYLLSSKILYSSMKKLTSQREGNYSFKVEVTHTGQADVLQLAWRGGCTQANAL